MNKKIRFIIALLLVSVIGGLIAYGTVSTTKEKSTISAANSQAEADAKIAAQAMKTVILNGHISLDMEPFMNDPRVVARLQESNIRVNFTRLGSRGMAEHLGKNSTTHRHPDFYIASGVVAGNQISEMAKSLKQNPSSYSPLYTPLIFATWKPIADILRANGMATVDAISGTYKVDNKKLLNAMVKKQKWADFKESGEFSVSRSVLVATTDVSSSNSAAMYLALMSFSLNDNNVVDNNEKAIASATALTELFTRQGYQENYVNGNFDDYTSVGMGKTPLAFIYENQMVAYARQQGKIKSNMVIAYPTPTIFNKQVFVALSEPAKKLGELISTDKVLQKIAVEYGFRSGSNKEFSEEANKNGLKVKEEILDVIDPPAHGFMTTMIDTVVSQTKK